MMPIPVIDLFAGPGGLGEGFSSISNRNGDPIFKIGLSIEKDLSARRTLVLRAFFRQFRKGEIPKDYYDYLAGGIPREELWSNHQAESKSADQEAWNAELGGESTPDQLIDERICKALAGRRDWLLIGGPPCQAYSVVGRSRVIGGEGLEKYEADPRHGLYRHYLRIIQKHRPVVFVMENVKGLLSAKIGQKKTFERILADLSYPESAINGRSNCNSKLEYRLFPLAPRNADLFDVAKPEDFVVRAEEHGIPQSRHRIIIVGIRGDIGSKPRPLIRHGAGLGVEAIIGDLPRIRSGLSRESDSAEAWIEVVRAAASSEWIKPGALPLKVAREIKAALRDLKHNTGCGAEFIRHRGAPTVLRDWFRDDRLHGVTNHSSRSHMAADLHRYLFAASFAKAMGRTPFLGDFPNAILPDHGNIAESLENKKFKDRFRVQSGDRPATTVVSHISKDGHYFIHYDPSQCRSLTVREAARLQTFPDNYHFEGVRTEQYRQVGNAVPPLLARQIAEVVAEIFGLGYERVEW
jgi:DNA (cytosine-5)-methyltransferase 1